MASITLNKYPNLPGQLINFKDGGYAYRSNSNTSNTESMLILGTSIDGPVMEPVAIDIETIEKVFGKDVNDKGVANGSTIVPAVKQAWDAGCRDIRVMRVTGTTAYQELKCTASVSTESVKKEDPLGVLEGNDLTEITLAHSTLIPTSLVSVKVGGIQLVPSNFTVDYVNAKVTINADASNAGANAAITYDYDDVQPATGTFDETLTLAGTTALTVSLAHVPYGATLVLKANSDGSIIPTTDYTIAGRIVTYTGATLVAGDKIDASYRYSAGTLTTTETYQIDATTGNIVPYILASSLQTVSLTEAPESGSIHVYIGGIEKPSSQWTYNSANNTIEFDKTIGDMNDTIIVDYLKSTSTTITKALRIESAYAGDVYNQATVKVESVNGAKVITITKPDSKKSQLKEVALTYSSSSYQTFQQFIDAVAADSRNGGLFIAKSDYPEANLNDLIDTTNGSTTAIPLPFVGGSDGVNATKQQMFQALSGLRDVATNELLDLGAYQLLEDYTCDWIVPTGVYADDVLAGRYDNFAYELALFCAVLSYRTKTTLGAISMKPNKDTSLRGIQNHYNYLLTYDNTYVMKDYDGTPIMDEDGNYIDLGKYISVVAGPEPYYKDVRSNYYGNPAVSYIALNSVLLPESSPTNKKLSNAVGLRYKFSNTQLDKLTLARFVTFKQKEDKNKRTAIHCVDGVSAALPGSDYTRITTPKVLRSVADEMRDVCEPYIGESNTIEQRNAMASAISKRLGILKEKGRIVDFSFQIIVTTLDQLLGQAKIELSIKAPQELRKITTIVALTV